ncbi:MAG: threonine synthase [Clostridia bacterium]|nr:threonine synthase [Clostridia bacterium]MDD4048270.1 threonine synthase [Clostridia bacterium]
MYISTRDNYQSVSAAKAIKLGMVPTGGLFVPENIPSLSQKDILAILQGSYSDVAKKILGLYLDDYLVEEISECVDKAYVDNFNHEDIVALHQLTDSVYVMELWHGPTAAFKDMALQVMPHLLSLALQKLEFDKEIVILVATSGDTGKAALEGFKDIPGIKIVCFYPYGGVSKIQERQMTTTDGKNTYVVGVKGNFDDCQNAVKAIFGDEEYCSFLAKNGYELSSANSINWGRLLPQIVYYVFSYLKLVKDKKISLGDKVNFVVPTGNFGNILAGWYAGKMGLPINKLICASNENKVLTDFFHTGVYEKNRAFKHTKSPSMDILVSSNLERFLYEMTGRDGKTISSWMEDLNNKGYFEIGDKLKEAIAEVLWADFATEDETMAMIKQEFNKTEYLMDTHTAVGMKVYEKYLKETGDDTVTILDSTASPFKFTASVLEALAGFQAVNNKDEFELFQELSKIVDMPVHSALKDLKEKPVLHDRVCEKGDIKKELEDIIGNFLLINSSYT